MGRPGQVLDQQTELVAAEAGHRVGLAQAPAEALGHDRQQPVAGGMAEPVVDRLEAVEIEDHHRDLALAPPRPGQRPLQPVLEQRPVGEAGQRVELGQARQALGLPLAGQGMADGALQDRRVEPGPIDEVGDPQRHGLKVELHRAAMAQQHDRRCDPAALDVAQQVEAVVLVVAAVEQADIDVAGAQAGGAGAQAAHPVQGEAHVGRGIQKVSDQMVSALVPGHQEDPDRGAIGGTRRFGDHAHHPLEIGIGAPNRGQPYRRRHRWWCPRAAGLAFPVSTQHVGWLP